VTVLARTRLTRISLIFSPAAATTSPLTPSRASRTEARLRFQWASQFIPDDASRFNATSSTSVFVLSSQQARARARREATVDSLKRHKNELYRTPYKGRSK